MDNGYHRLPTIREETIVRLEEDRRDVRKTKSRKQHAETFDRPRDTMAAK